METATKNTVTLSVPELEAIIHRIVRAAAREEMAPWFGEERIQPINVVEESSGEAAITITGAELEAIIQRAVKEEVNRALFEFWTQEGEDDPEEDERLLKDALEQIEKCGDDHSSFITLEELKAELAAETNTIQNQNRSRGAQRD